MAVCLALLLALSGRVEASEAAFANAPSALDAVTIFCHAGPASDHRAPVLPHRLHEAGVLQAGLAAPAHLAIAVGSPGLPPPRLLAAARPGTPQARAPPASCRASCYATGPPSPL